ncbi:MAG: DNA gyrase subunit A [Candidatus Borkfalkiaceae bacterium]|nr:DNA gyrase subunit A [bacterium]MDY2850652.1 DNA gyrase subunit A [Christensenellaceae bacterium]
MAKKENNSALTAEFKEVLNKTNIIDIEVEQEMKKSFIAYAMAVNVSRAIPDVRDGLKPVHRRILYSMHDIGLYNEKPYKKCATIVGDVLGKFHPHGDSSVYDALVRLAQDFSINCPLVDGHGNFGSVDGDPPAAYRYTEAKMSKLAAEMLRDIDKETVDFYPNFDDTRMQPAVLPARIPNLLVNGSDGIAVGMATNIPPHNLGEVIDGVIAQMDNPEITIDELINYIQAPDFPTGAIIMGRNGIKQAYRTGRGNIIIRAKTEIEEFNNGTRNRIVVTELPYQVNKQKLIETIADYVKDKKLEGISDINDESDRSGMRIVIDVKKDANAQVVLNSLFKHTDLQKSDGIIMLALVDGEPKTLNLKQIIDCYIRHQIDVITRRTRYDLAKTEEREHIIKGLVIALANVDEVIAIIRKSLDKNEACAKLMSSFELDDKQANAILEMRLQRLTSLEVEKLREELAELDRQIADFKDILAKPERVQAIIKQDLTEIKEKYAVPRKTEISTDPFGIEDADLIPVEDVVVSMTHFGYVKRLPVSEYRAQHRGGRGVTAHKPKEEDFVENMFVCSSHDDILFFTNFGKVYCMKAYYIPEAQRTARGRAVVNLIQIEDGERVAAMIPAKEGGEGYIALATKKGLIKKTKLSEFANIRKTGKIAISINEGDELIGVQFTTGEDELIVASRQGKCIRFSETDVRATGRDTMGVRAIELDENDILVDLAVIKPGDQIITISSNGFGKRSSTDDYRLQNRGGKGIKAGIFDEKTGYLVNLKVIDENQDVMLIADTGVTIRVKADEISMIGRSTKGVRIMKLGEGNIASVALAPHEDEEETDGEEEVVSDETTSTEGTEAPFEADAENNGDGETNE